MQTLIEQGVSTALATFEAIHNESSVNSGNGGGIPVFTKNNPISYSYNDILAYQPQSFFGMEGALGLSYWIDLMEAVFCISSCTNYYRVKYNTCTLIGSTLTWWNNHTKSIRSPKTYVDRGVLFSTRS